MSAKSPEIPDRDYRKAFNELACGFVSSMTKERSLKIAHRLLSSKLMQTDEYESITAKATPTELARALFDYIEKKGSGDYIRQFVAEISKDESSQELARTIENKAKELHIGESTSDYRERASKATSTDSTSQGLLTGDGAQINFLGPPMPMSSLSTGDGARASKDTPRIGYGQARDTEYDLSQNPRGMAIIINNSNFKDPQKLSVRYGSDSDEIALEQTFTKFLFDVQIHKDQTAAQMEKILEKVSKVDHGNYGAFVCAVLSHGGPGVVFGSDAKELKLDKIFEPFRRDKCKSLVGKPKLFFIQACRGDEVDAVSKDCGLGKALKPTKKRRHWTETWPREADFLIGFATTPECVSFRNSHGSFFIQELCKIFRSHPTMELHHMLIRVSREVAMRFGEDPKDYPRHYLKQMPSIVSQLTRELRFPK